MATATAAYCIQCRDYVLVTNHGDCAHGHPRQYLRGIYLANVDLGTGRPQPPSLDRNHRERPAAPVAPVAEFAPGFPPSQMATPQALPPSPSGRLFGAARSAIDRLIGAPKGRQATRSID